MENKGAIGKITQVISAVLDIKFPEVYKTGVNPDNICCAE